MKNFLSFKRFSATNKKNNKKNMENSDSSMSASPSQTTSQTSPRVFTQFNLLDDDLQALILTFIADTPFDEHNGGTGTVRGDLASPFASLLSSMAYNNEERK